MALGQTVGKRRWAGIRCDVLPANRFSHKLCSPSLEQGQVSAIQDPIHPSSVNHNQVRLSFFITHIHAASHLSVLVPLGENRQAAAA